MDFITQWMQDVLLVVFCNVSDLLHYVSSHIIVKTTITLLIVDNKHRTPLPRTRAKLPRKPKGRFVAREAARHVPLEAAVGFGRPPCRSLAGAGSDGSGAGRSGAAVFLVKVCTAVGSDPSPVCLAVSSALRSRLQTSQKKSESLPLSVRPSRCPEKTDLKAWPSDGPYVFRSAHRDVIYVSLKRVEGLLSSCCSAGLLCSTCVCFLSERQLGTVWLRVVCQTED